MNVKANCGTFMQWNSTWQEKGTNKGKIMDKGKNVGKALRHNAKWEKPDSRGYTQYGSILTTICESKAIGKESRLVVSKDWDRRRYVLLKNIKGLLGVIETF